MPSGDLNQNLLISSWYFRILLAIGILLLFYTVYRERKRLHSLLRTCLLIIINLLIAMILLTLGPLMQDSFSFFYQSGLSAPLIYLKILSELKLSVILNSLTPFGIITGIYVTAIIAYARSLRQYAYWVILLLTILIFCIVDIYFCFIIPSHYRIINILFIILCNIIGGLFAAHVLGYLYDYINTIIDKTSLKNKSKESIRLFKYMGLSIIGFLLLIFIFLSPIGMRVHLVLDDWNSLSFIYTGDITKDKEIFLKEPSPVDIGYSSDILNIRLISDSYATRSPSQNMGESFVPITVSISKNNKIRNIYKGKILAGDIKIEGNKLSTSIEGYNLSILYVPYGKRITFQHIEAPVLRSAKNQKVNTATIVNVNDGDIKYQFGQKTHSTIDIVTKYIYSLKGNVCKISLPNNKIIDIPAAQMSIISIGLKNADISNYEISFWNGKQIVSILSEDKLFWLPDYGEVINSIIIRNPVGKLHYGNNNIEITPDNDYIYLGGEMLTIKKDNGKIRIDGDYNVIVLGESVLSLSFWQRLSAPLQGSIVGALIGLIGLIGNYIFSVRNEIRKMLE